MIFHIWAALVSAFVVVLGVRALRQRSGISSLKDIQFKEIAWPKISFIVPACNEELTLKAAAQSLLQINYPQLEVTLINDRSTDLTGAVANELAMKNSRINVLHVDELPEGWLGKVHALHRGIEGTNGEWILIADADIHFSVDTLKKAVSYCEENKIDYLTSVPNIKSKNIFLRTLIAQLFHQGSLFIDPLRLNDPRQKTCYGMGAFMLFRRSVYERSEKMPWLRMEALDDTGLALLMRRAGAKMGVLAGLGELNLEWYPSLLAYVKGVEKNAFAYYQYSWFYMLMISLGNWAMTFGMVGAPFLSHSIAVQLISTLTVFFYLIAVYLQAKKFMHLPFYLICLFPLATALLPIIHIRAAILATVRGGIRWRGTFYPLCELIENQRLKLVDLMFFKSDISFGTLAEGGHWHHYYLQS